MVGLLWRAGFISPAIVAVLVAHIPFASGALEEAPPTITAGTESNRLSVLSPSLQDKLRRQAESMKNLYLVFEERRLNVDADHPPYTKTFSATFSGNRIYERRNTVLSEAGKEKVQIIDRAFDGMFVFMAEPKQIGRNRFGSLLKYLVTDDTDPALRGLVFEFPYLKAAGFFAPQYFPEMRDFASIQPLLLHLLEANSLTKLETENGDVRVTLSFAIPHYSAIVTNNLQRNVSILLKSAYGYAVAEQEEKLPSGECILRIKNENFKYYEQPGIWLPDRSVWQYYTDPWKLIEFAGKPIVTTVYQLLKVEFEQKDAPFDLTTASDYKVAGTRVGDRTLVEARSRPNHSVNYTVAANGELLRVNAESIAQQMSRSRFWFLFAIILSLPAMFFLFQQSRKSRRN
jgi:hypothetical protein